MNTILLLVCMSTEKNKFMIVRLANCLKDNFMNQRLPSWVGDIAGLDSGANFQDLPSEIAVDSKAEEKAVTHFITTVLNRRLRDRNLRKTRCFPHSKLILNEDLVNSLKMTVRTSNGLSKYIQSVGKEANISDLTFGDLADIQHLGSKSILEFLNTIEAHDCSTSIAPNNSSSDTSSLDETPIDDEINELLENLGSQPGLDQVFRGDLRFPSLNISLPISSYQRGSSLKSLLEEVSSIYQGWQYPDKLRLKELLTPLLPEISRISEMQVDISLKHLISMQYPRAKQANLDAIYNRFGLNKKGVLTLEECGQMAGITRERIRQIESKISKGITETPGEGKIFMPSFWNAVELLYQEKGSSIESIAAKFVSLGICRDPVSVEGILFFNKILRGEDLNLVIETLKNGNKILAIEGLNLGGIFVQLNKLYSRNGVASLKLAYEYVADEIVGADYQDIVSIVSSSGMWKSLDVKNTWWIPINLDDIARNRLINVGRKALSVASSVSVEDLKKGYERLATYRNSSSNVYSVDSTKNIVVPPENIIIEFFKNIPNFNVSGALISFDGELDFREVLGTTEIALVETILESGKGVISRVDLLRGGATKGINEASLNAYITYSSVIKHAGMDMHQVVGNAVDAGVLLAHKESVSKKGKKTKRVLLADWDQGYIRIACRLPEFATTLVVGAPSSVRPQLVNKKFEIYDEEGQRYGTVGVNEQGSIYGMSAFCTPQETQEDDILLMRFDLLSSKVILRIIDFAEFQELSDS